MMSDVAASEWDRVKDAGRQARERQRMLGEQRDVELRQAATAGTLRQRRKHVVAELFERARITAEQKQAADEIARVFYALTSELLPRVSRFNELRNGRAIDTDWRPSLSAAYRQRYKPWHEAVSRVGMGHRVSLYELVSAVVIDNYGVRQVAGRLGMDQRTVLTHLREALWLYAEMAGWVDHRMPLLGAAPVVVAMCESGC